MASVITPTKVTGVSDGSGKSPQVALRDLVIDTGTYVTGGNTITAASLGLRTIDFVDFGSQGMTGGTAGATVNWIGVRYASDRLSVTIQQYESAATGLPGLEKTNGEATVANATVRVKFESYA